MLEIQYLVDVMERNERFEVSEDGVTEKRVLEHET